jgi:hypothetical protein
MAGFFVITFFKVNFVTKVSLHTHLLLAACGAAAGSLFGRAAGASCSSYCA